MDRSCVPDETPTALAERLWSNPPATIDAIAEAVAARDAEWRSTLRQAHKRRKVVDPTTAVSREPFGGKCYGIWNVEGDGEPLMIMSGRAALERELERRRALPEDDDDHLTEYHQVFPCDVAGAWWNSYDPDPRADEPLTLAEIIAVQGGNL